MLLKYVTHNSILIIVCCVFLILYTLNSSFLYRNLIVFLAVTSFILTNLLFHKKHLQIHAYVILEYILFGLMIFLSHLILTLF